MGILFGRMRHRGSSYGGGQEQQASVGLKPSVKHTEAPVPRYFFNARSGTSFTQDWEGQDLPSLDAARGEALKVAERFWGDLSPNVAREALAIEISDETGEKLTTVNFKEAIGRLAQGTPESIRGSKTS